MDKVEVEQKKFIIVTGLSGAGKSLAAKVLEDFGYFCVDNLPPLLIPKFAEIVAQSHGSINKVALVSDVRGGRFFDHLLQALASLEDMGFGYEILFLEASDEVLVRRYKESRRRHPLSVEGGVLEGLELEKRKLQHIRERANKIIDTSNLGIGEFKNTLAEWLEQDDKERMLINIVSFGFKHGIPLDADLVFDVRFLPNPYWVNELRDHIGTEKIIKDFLLQYSLTKTFVEKLNSFLLFLIPNYIKEGKAQLTITIGCTGGKHRSVAIADWLGVSLGQRGYSCVVEHRDITQWSGKHG